jgi:uncharacterized protein (DUF302 family)
MDFVITVVLMLISTMSLSGEHEMSTDGVIALRRNFGLEATMNRFEVDGCAGAMTIFCHIDYAAGAASVDQRLAPTDPLIFGAAKTGTPLMQSTQTIGIDR